MMFDSKYLENIHKFSFQNKNHLIFESQKCGCFHCMHIFLAKDIEHWTDRGDTAICPNCKVDSIVPNIPEYLPISFYLLNSLNKKYFDLP